MREVREFRVEGSRNSRMIEFAECAFATDAIRKWRWRASEAKVALVSHIEYALKFETEPIPDHVAIRDARRATTRAYQRSSVAPFVCTLVRSGNLEDQKLGNAAACTQIEPPYNLVDYPLFIVTAFSAKSQRSRQ